MNWYSLLKIADVRGEYWIDDSGRAMEASGDGDFNHEGYVIDYAQNYLSEGNNYESWKQAKALEILEEKKQELENQKSELEDTVQDTTQIDKEIYENWEQSRQLDYYAYELLSENLSPDEIVLLDIAEGHGGDPREFAMKNMRWKRLEGNNIEAWTLTEKDLQAIANGLYEAYSEDNDEKLDNETFNIYVYSTKSWYRNISWQDIDRKNIRAITQDRLVIQ